MSWLLLLRPNNCKEVQGVRQISTARTLLTWTYGLLGIIAGTDKFLHLLAHWHKYLASIIADILPFEAHAFMYIVGIIEIVAGLLVLIKPRIGSIIVSIWLFCIAINLVLTGDYYDIAVRDLVMSIGAFSLFLLSKLQRDH